MGRLSPSSARRPCTPGHDRRPFENELLQVHVTSSAPPGIQTFLQRPLRRHGSCHMHPQETACHRLGRSAPDREVRDLQEDVPDLVTGGQDQVERVGRSEIVSLAGGECYIIQGEFDCFHLT